MTQVAQTFVRSVVRMPVGIKGSLIRTARQEYRSIRKALEERRVFARFERVGNDTLQCVFSPKAGALLGETVRDRFASTEESPLNFLWCEKLEGEEGEELALVCVLDGRVLREVFASPENVQPKAEQLIRRGYAHSPDFQVFLYGLTPEEIGLDPTRQKISVLEQSILDYIEPIKRRLPKVGSYRSAISRIATTFRIQQILIVSAAVAVLVLPASYYGLRWHYDLDAFALEPFEVGEWRQLYRQYDDLLTATTPDAVLPALHRAVTQFLTNPVFGAYWQIERLSWTRGTQTLEIHGILRKGASPPEDEGEALSPDREADLLEAAESLGWSLHLDQFNGTFLLPLEWEPRSEDEVLNLRLAPPLFDDDPWDFRQLAEDMAPFGELKPGNGPVQNSIYQIQSYTLHLSQEPWLNGQTAKWLGWRLSDGPVSLDSVLLEPSPGRSGVVMEGTINFSLVWRNAS